MNKNIIIQESPTHIKYILYRSPINNINFIKNNEINIKTKREYAKADVLLKDDINNIILEYFISKDIDASKIAFLSYIKIIKINYNKKDNRTFKTFTIVNRRNTIKTNKLQKYYSKRNSFNIPRHVITKGFGKVLLEYIEQDLKNKGFEYIILVPSVKSLIKYYKSLGYKPQIIPNNKISKENEEYQMKYNKEYVTQSLIMYKKI
jgi:hypothetical protein